MHIHKTHTYIEEEKLIIETMLPRIPTMKSGATIDGAKIVKTMLQK